MRNALRSLVSTTALVSGFALAVACGGGSTPDPKTASDPTNASEKGSGSGDTPEASAAADPAGTGPGTETTTTTALPDGGELQGAKLSGGSTHTEVETKGESGPKRPKSGSANEPGRTAKDLQTIVGSRRDEARACYDKALPSHPGIEGDLDIKWKIDPEGNVTDAELDTTKSQILEPAVAQCVIDVIKKIKFAPSKGGYETRAHYPFNFHPKQTTKKSGAN